MKFGDQAVGNYIHQIPNKEGGNNCSCSDANYSFADN